MRWDNVDGATRYEVRHKVEPQIVPWPDVLLSTTEPKLTLSLFLDVWHLIQVRAVNNYGESRWSDIIYMYPTRTPAGAGDWVGIIPVVGYRSDGSYDYVLCLNIPPLLAVASGTTTTTTVLIGAARAEHISDGAEEWETETAGMVTTSAMQRNCSATELSRPDNADNSVDIIRVVPNADVGEYCNNSDAGACAWRDTSRTGVINAARITISDAATTLISQGLSCSVLFRHAMHEAGHVFGLNHPNVDGESVMHNTADNSCSPKVADIQAIIKIYQSR